MLLLRFNTAFNEFQVIYSYSITRVPVDLGLVTTVEYQIELELNFKRSRYITSD